MVFRLKMMLVNNAHFAPFGQNLYIRGVGFKVRALMHDKQLAELLENVSLTQTQFDICSHFSTDTRAKVSTQVLASS